MTDDTAGPSRLDPTRLDHVNIVVADMSRSVAFYTRLLGFAVVMDRVLDGDWFDRLCGRPGARAHCVILDAAAGGCRIELLAFAGDDGSPHRPALGHFALRMSGLDERAALLRSELGQALDVVEVPRDIVRSGKRMCYLTDPDGVTIELCEYGAAVPEFC